MKKISTSSAVLTFVLLLASVDPLHSQKEWISDGAIWHYDYMHLNYQGYFSYYYSHDTLMMGREYKVIAYQSYIYDFNSDSVEYSQKPSAFYLRTESNVVFWYHQNMKTEYVLYDFNLMVGDTLTIPPAPMVDSSMAASHGETACAYVDSIAYLSAGNDSLKTYYLNYDQAPDEPAYTFGDVIYEKIGSPQGFFPVATWMIIEGPGGIRCYQDNNLPPITFTSKPCNYINSVDEAGIFSDIKIFPNPVGDYLTINIQDSRKKLSAVLLFSSGGKLIRRFDPASDKFRFGEIPAGVYILQIYLGEEVVQRKIVKLRD